VAKPDTCSGIKPLARVIWATVLQCGRHMRQGRPQIVEAM
jgi:hypothetical protein